MTQIEKVSIGGYAFTLDKEAATLAQNYLTELGDHYSSYEGGAEIMEGIEERMAELILEKCGPEGVAGYETIQWIISKLGRPETIEDEASEYDGDAPRKKNREPKKKLYRDVDGRIIGGVCSGLAQYFNIDVAIVRLICMALFILTCFSWVDGHGSVTMTMPIAYIVLWICMPAAKTVQQRCEQRGERGTLDDIQRSVKKGAAEVENAVRNVGKSDGWREFGNFVTKFIGIILLLLGFAGILAGSLVLIGDMWPGLMTWVTDELDDFPALAGALSFIWMRIIVLLVFFLPFIGILYGALQMLFGFKSPKWHPGLIIFILWLLSIVALAVICAMLLTPESFNLIHTGVHFTEMKSQMDAQIITAATTF